MLTPLADYILLEELPPADRGPGGLIVIPDTSQQKFNQGVVVNIGDDAFDKVSYQKGDILVFPLHSEYRVTHHNRKFILVRASEIIAKITPESHEPSN